MICDGRLLETPLTVKVVILRQAVQAASGDFRLASGLDRGQKDPPAQSTGWEIGLVIRVNQKQNQAKRRIGSRIRNRN